MKFIFLAAVLIVAIADRAQGFELESVSDDDLVHIIKQDSFAVVLFCKYKLLSVYMPIFTLPCSSQEELQ